MAILRTFGTNILVVPLSVSFLGYNISKKQFLYSFLGGILFIILTILIFDNYSLLIAFSGILGSLVVLVYSENSYITLVRRMKRLYPLISDIAKSLLLKFQKLKHLHVKVNNIIETKSTTLNNFSLFIFSYYFVFSLYLDGNKSLLPYLIIIGYISVLIFMLRDILFPERLVKKYSNLYYFICLTFCLPLISSYLLLYYTSSLHSSYLWVINSLLTTFLLYQFLNSTEFFNKYDYRIYIRMYFIYARKYEC